MALRQPAPLPELAFHPATPERWADLEALFGERGACCGCWCMWWRLKRSQWEQQRGEGNKQAFKQIVASGEVPGILAYAGGQAIGGCSVAPRETFSAMERSRTLKRIDDEPVWSIVCFFVAKPFRRKGVTVRLLRAAVEHVRSQGGKVVEGYPTRPEKGTADAFVYMGLASAFLQAGFEEVARPSKTRSIMRLRLDTTPRDGYTKGKRAQTARTNRFLQTNAMTRTSNRGTGPREWGSEAESPRPRNVAKTPSE